MVRIRLPPPAQDPRPVHSIVRASHTLVRIFDPTDYDATCLSFRQYGPLRRFDHHRSFTGKPEHDAERGIYYCAYNLDGCVVEVFGDIGVIECEEKQAAYVYPTRALRLLDLRTHGAMRAGSVAALGQNADYAPSQEWSRYFYDHPETYGTLDGLLYRNAHNHGDAIALYERAEAALTCPADTVFRLDDPALRSELRRIALDNHLIPLF